MSESASVQLFHPRGPKVFIPLKGENAAQLLQEIDSFLEGGWLTAAPGLEAGEEKEEIGWVLRLDHEKDGETTPTVLLYSANPSLTWSYLRRYMNTHDDVKAFEAASGLKYDQLEPYPGNDHPQRGASPRTDRFIVQAPKPFGLIWRPNPKYKEAPAGQDTRTLSEKRKRDFVRWDGQSATSPDSTEPSRQKPPDDNGMVQQWVDWMNGKTTGQTVTLSVLNDNLHDLKKLSEETRKAIWAKVKDFAQSKMWEWSDEKKQFISGPF
jgi:hypothetical protein